MKPLSLCAFLLCTVAFAQGASPEENRGKRDLYEGDMRLTPEQARALYGGKLKRAAVKDTKRLWPKGQVPYVIDKSLGDKARTAINAAIADYKKFTCIRLIPRKQQKDYVNFRNGDGCSSPVGKKGGKQDISLGPRCLVKGIVIHEIGHAVGFYHEQSRPDRDKFVEILSENIEEGKKGNFKKMNSKAINSFGLPYDYWSVMHYGEKFFSKNGKPTIRVKQEGARIGQRMGLSRGDCNQLNKLYPSCKTG